MSNYRENSAQLQETRCCCHHIWKVSFKDFLLEYWRHLCNILFTKILGVPRRKKSWNFVYGLKGMKLNIFGKIRCFALFIYEFRWKAWLTFSSPESPFVTIPKIVTKSSRSDHEMCDPLNSRMIGSWRGPSGFTSHSTWEKVQFRQRSDGHFDSFLDKRFHSWSSSRYFCFCSKKVVDSCLTDKNAKTMWP